MFKNSRSRSPYAEPAGLRTSRVAAKPLTAAVVCVALAAPALLFAAQDDASSIDLTASGAIARLPDQDSYVPAMGITQVPVRGRTQVPATPVTPRPHYEKKPANLP
jgi:hypothetical protein